MGFKDLFKRKEKEVVVVNDGVDDYPPSFVARSFTKFGPDYVPLFTNQSRMNHSSMNLSAVFRAVELISSTVAQLPLEIYQLDDKMRTRKKYVDHKAYYILSREPNSYMTRYTFIKCMIMNMLLSGNAYASINRDDRGVIKSLGIINPNNVSVLIDKSTGQIAYKIQGVDIAERIIDSSDIIHVQNIPDASGIKGISTLEYANQTLKLSTDSENMASNFFGTNALTGYLKMKLGGGKLQKEQREQVRADWQNQIANMSSFGLPVLDTESEFVPLNIKDGDVQLLASRKFNIECIARFFNVNPILLYDLTKNSYSSSEHASLQLLNDCIAPILEKFELEFERKIFLPGERLKIDVKFDTQVMLRLDKLSQAEYFTKLFNIGVLSVNEIREYIDLEPVSDGDLRIVQANTSTFEEIKSRTTNNQVNAPLLS